MSERREVRVGADHFVLRPFRGFKALLVLARLTALTEIAPEIQNQVRARLREHRESSQVEIPRNVFELRYPDEAQGISETAWEKAGHVIRLPDPDVLPLDGATVFLAVLPRLLKLARTEVLEILALVVVGDDELRRADEEGTVDELVESAGKKLLYEGTLEELAELGLAAAAVVQEQYQGKVAELVGMFSDLLGGLDQEDDPMLIPDDPEMDMATPETSSGTSSISSPESTDGPEPKPSGTAGMTSSPSPTA